jgi:predicted enzyme related to lactoylglutathione lyase
MARAKRFYEQIFGFKYKDSGMPGGEYWLIDNGSKDQGGGLQPAQDGKTGHLTVYFDVDDIDKAVQQVRELGGTADEKLPVPGEGWFSGCLDSEGNAFSLWQSDKTAPMPQGVGAGSTTA